jgi:N-acetyl-D-muramate 6-phosphate phosphatase
VSEPQWPPLRGVLFDLDGTLLDTAPDLAAALNRLRGQHQLTPLAFSDIRPHVSHGSAALITLGFGFAESDPRFESLRLALLSLYHENIANLTRPFDGMFALLAELKRRGLKWGIVTNKPGWLTTPLLARFDFGIRPECVVSGDTVATAKPDPGPLLHGVEQLELAPAQCVYIGDAERDVAAGIRAGMRTLIALYGYLGPDDQPHTWGADAYLRAPLDLIEWIDQLS